MTFVSVHNQYIYTGFNRGLQFTSNMKRGRGIQIALGSPEDTLKEDKKAEGGDSVGSFLRTFISPQTLLAFGALGFHFGLSWYIMHVFINTKCLRNHYSYFRSMDLNNPPANSWPLLVPNIEDTVAAQRFCAMNDDQMAKMLSGVYNITEDVLKNSTNQFMDQIRSSLPTNRSFSGIATGNTSNLCLSRGIPPAIEKRHDNSSLMIGSVVNVPLLLLVFEWITTGFAFSYCFAKLKFFSKAIRRDEENGESSGNNSFKKFVWFTTIIIWNFMIVIAELARGRDATPIPYNNLVLVFILMVLASIVQIQFMNLHWGGDKHDNTHDKDKHKVVEDQATEMRIQFRYAEYAITAPVLMIAVQSIVVTQWGWAIVFAFAAMAVTNLIGIPLHTFTVEMFRHAPEVEIQSDPANPEFVDPSSNSPVILVPIPKPPKQYTAQVHNCRIMIAYCLITSWVVFFTGWLVYFKHVTEMTKHLPDGSLGIKFLVGALPAAYISFGVAGSFLYIPSIFRSPDDARWYFNKSKKWLEVAYDLLSLFIKATTVMIVLASDMHKPSARAC
jgi:hypothetical protein